MWIIFMMKNENTIVVYIKVHLCWWCRYYYHQKHTHILNISINADFYSCSEQQIQ